MRKQKGRVNKFLIATLVGGATLFECGVASAIITQQCGYCHTMHNSQDGGAFSSLVGGASIDPTSLNGALLRWDCAGCHSGDNTAASIAAVPKVYRTAGAPNYFNGDDIGGSPNNSLAGGDFYYVTQDDAKGHNVDIVVAADGVIGQTPPGFDSGNHAGIGADWAGNQLKCAGTYGCHGNHSQGDSFAAISGAHHGQSGTVDGSTVGDSYRWLFGILGTEDDDWEYTRSAWDHNQYHGADRPKIVGGDAIDIDTRTISYLCAECHGLFHNNNAVNGGTINSDGAWMRHPTDYDMANTPDTSEYAAYPGSGGTIGARPYSTATPVASNVEASPGPLATVNLQQASANDTAIVTCISCHRAHASPYADLVRWDYVTECYTGNGNVACGCFNCHTSKD